MMGSKEFRMMMDSGDDDKIDFPSCEECQIYFMNIKHLEIHNG